MQNTTRHSVCYGNSVSGYKAHGNDVPSPCDGSFDTHEDPISPFKDHTIALLESALNLPRATFDRRDLYPSLIDKATILYYTLNKNHPFRNGNKRISTAALLVFLFINDHWLDAGKEEMTQQALDVANSKLHEREEVLRSVKIWIQGHIIVSNERELVL